MHKVGRAGRRRWRVPARFLAAAGLVAVLLANHPVSGPPGDASQARLRIATGSPGAVYYAYGQAIANLIRADLPGVAPEVLVTAASAENARLLTGGGAEVGFIQADVAAAYRAGSPLPLAAVARLYDDYLHLVVRVNGGVTQLGDLRGARVSLGPAGSGTEVTARRLLRVAGMAPDDFTLRPLDLEPATAALREGSIDAFFFSGGLPVAAVSRLAADLPIRLVDLGHWVTGLRAAYGESYVTREVPASVYGIERVATVAIPNYLVVPATMPEGQAFALTRLLIEHRDLLGRAHPAAQRLNRRVAISTYPLPLHPGAARYYRESKI
ncbi:TAXI family TRAP transporter solute-binding subunit [Rhizomonospora bruguierae]|uniref:TAXI family TRAP transporter solute-binding subunit n=1 Tax=Rhizomonospora bruguierae TaxID=1581705 RepID=UPI001BCD917F|nr:TAXI family TRAP transporter solute-binding subunit [Micromonospora sp. NBRC 107566]